MGEKLEIKHVMKFLFHILYFMRISDTFDINSSSNLLVTPSQIQCGHIFCAPCIQALQTSKLTTCPLCRAKVSRRDLKARKDVEDLLKAVVFDLIPTATLESTTKKDLKQNSSKKSKKVQNAASESSSDSDLKAEEGPLIKKFFRSRDLLHEKGNEMKENVSIVEMERPTLDAPKDKTINEENKSNLDPYHFSPSQKKRTVEKRKRKLPLNRKETTDVANSVACNGSRFRVRTPTTKVYSNWRSRTSETPLSRRNSIPGREEMQESIEIIETALEPVAKKQKLKNQETSIQEDIQENIEILEKVGKPFSNQQKLRKLGKSLQEDMEESLEAVENFLEPDSMKQKSRQPENVLPEPEDVKESNESCLDPVVTDHNLNQPELENLQEKVEIANKKLEPLSTEKKEQKKSETTTPLVDNILVGKMFESHVLEHLEQESTKFQSNIEIPKKANLESVFLGTPAQEKEKLSTLSSQPKLIKKVVDNQLESHIFQPFEENGRKILKINDDAQEMFLGYTSEPQQEPLDLSMSRSQKFPYGQKKMSALIFIKPLDLST